MTTHYRSVISILVLALGLTLGVSGCQTTSTKWEHASVPKEQWSADGAQCRYEARRKAEERLAASNSLYASSSSQDLTVNQMMAQEKVSDRAKDYFARCMSALGYDQVEK